MDAYPFLSVSVQPLTMSPEATAKVEQIWQTLGL